jgi:hypothetical protein
MFIAMKPGMTTLSIAALSVTKLRIAAVSIVTFGMMIVSKKTWCQYSA